MSDISNICKLCKYSQNPLQRFKIQYEKGKTYKSLCALSKTLEEHELTDYEKKRIDFYVGIKKSDCVELKN